MSPLRQTVTVGDRLSANSTLPSSSASDILTKSNWLMLKPKSGSYMIQSSQLWGKELGEGWGARLHPKLILGVVKDGEGGAGRARALATCQLKLEKNLYLLQICHLALNW